MAINENTDYFLVNSGGSSYKVLAKDLANVTGSLLVNRNQTSYKCDIADAKDKIQPNDVLLVNRNQTSYKVLGSEVLTLFGPTEILIRGITWSIDPATSGTLVDGSGAGTNTISETWLYDDIPQTGIAIRTTTTGDKATLLAEFNMGKYYKVTKILYKPWTDQIAIGSFGSSAYAINQTTLRQYSGMGFSNASTIEPPKNPNQTASIMMTLLPTFQNFVSEFRVSNDQIASGSITLAVGGLEVYGYEVDFNGNPIT